MVSAANTLIISLSLTHTKLSVPSLISVHREGAGERPPPEAEEAASRSRPALLMLSMAGSPAGMEMLERGSDASSKETVWRKGNPGRGNRLNKDQRSRKLNKWQGAGVAGEPVRGASWH